MICEPQNFYERLAASIMYEIMTRDLLAVDCKRVVDRDMGEGCQYQVRFISGAVEQLSAVIAEMLEIEDDD